MIKNKRRNSSINKRPPPPSNQQKKPGMLSTLADSMVWGTGIGIGSEAGHSIFRGVFGNNNQKDYHTQNVNSACEDMTKLYEKCLIRYSFDKDECEFLKHDLDKICKI